MAVEDCGKLPTAELERLLDSGLTDSDRTKVLDELRGRYKNAYVDLAEKREATATIERGTDKKKSQTAAASPERLASKPATTHTMYTPPSYSRPSSVWQDIKELAQLFGIIMVIAILLAVLGIRL